MTGTAVQIVLAAMSTRTLTGTKPHFSQGGRGERFGGVLADKTKK
jgi:hypothetical protein